MEHRRARQDHSLKRLTLLVDQAGEYPGSITFRRLKDDSGRRTGNWEEDRRYRNLHPMLAHVIELWRWENFDLEPDLAHSNRAIHVYTARNKETRELKAGQDQRIVAMVLIPEAEVVRNGDGELLEIRRVEAALSDVMGAMRRSLEASPGRRPFWNRLIVHIQPVLGLSETEAAAYAETLAVRHSDSLRELGLEKVVVKGQIEDDRHPDGSRAILIRVNNPTGYSYETTIDSVIRARVENEDRHVGVREVLVRNGAYERWLEAQVSPDTQYAIPYGEWASADTPIRAATPIEIREQQARGRGTLLAYRIPALLEQVAENFRVEYSGAPLRPVGSERPPSSNHSRFVELDLDPATTAMDTKTGMLNPNVGELIPAVTDSGSARPIGQNQAGVVIGIQNDELAEGVALRRMLILSDLTHSKGALTANECTRINAALRLAASEGIPVDWFTASSGVEIHKQRGVGGLAAAASTVREIVQLGHSLGVPINLVVSDVNIGAQSYWNALAAILHDTGGVLIMTPKGSMALTGPDALTVAMQRDLHSEELPGRSRHFFPAGLQTLAGYREVHGPNGEAMALAPNLPAAAELLMRHHYFSHARHGDLVSQRQIGGDDSPTRDITQSLSPNGRTNGDSEHPRNVGDEIEDILGGRAGSREAILEALRDQNSPEPVRWWADAQGIRHQPGGNGLQPQRFGSLIQEMQIGGRPTMAIFPPVGPLTPADSEIIGRAIFKANGRMPVLIIGSLTGFNADPRSMENRQLFGGSTIAEAIVRHRGPITVVNLGYIVGGTFVVVSKELNPHLDILALDGSHVQVIGGASAAKVVFRSDVRKAAAKVGEVVAAARALEEAKEKLRTDNSEAQQAEVARLEAEHTQVWRQAISEIETQQGASFDQVHSVQKALAEGAIDEVITPQNLREAVIRHQEALVAQYLEQRQHAEQQTFETGVDQLTRRSPSQAVAALIASLERGAEPDQARALAADLVEGLRRYTGGSDPESGGS